MFREQLSSLIEQLDHTDDSIKPRENHWDFFLDKVSLWTIVQALEVSPKIYFFNKESSQEFLGLGATQVFNKKSELPFIHKIIESDEKIIFLGGIKFDHKTSISPEWKQFGEMSLILPRILFINNSNESKTVVRLYKKDGETLYHLKKEVRLILNHLKNEEKTNYQRTEQKLTPDFNLWSQNINRALELIEKNDLKKIVLARKIIQQNHISIDADEVCRPYGENKANHFLFYQQLAKDQAFFSMTPERLFKVENHKLNIDAIAGTRPVLEDEIKTQSYSDELQLSPKEANEHQAVVDDISEKIKSLKLIPIIGKRNILKLKYVQHLFTPLEAEFDQSLSLDKLLQTFHPTPAVGGTPRELALEKIYQIENFDRGFYAGPAGVISKNYTDICVAIRSFLVSNHQLHIIAGVGVVAGSMAQHEWKETEAKFKNFKSLYEVANGP